MASSHGPSQDGSRRTAGAAPSAAPAASARTVRAHDDHAGQTAAPARAEATGDGARGRRWPVAALWAVAGLVVVAGLAAQVWRPLAPDLGAPPDPRLFFDADHLARVAAYQEPKRVVAGLALLLRVALPVAAVVSRPGRRAIDAVVRRVGGDRRPALGAAAVGLAVVVAVDLAIAPLAFWSGYVHDGAFGLRTQGLAGWLRDWVVGAVPAWLLVGVGLAVVSRLVRRLPRAWPPVVALGAALLAVVLVALAPLVLEPLRFSFTPLPPGEVRDTVTAVLDEAGVDVDAILVADASRRTTRQNAYVSGLGSTRRVVLYDTLLAGRSAEEIGVVFAHELGHDLHRDLARGTLLGAAGTITVTAAVAWALRREVRGGRLASPADPRAAAVAVAVVVVLSALSLPLQSAVSRRAEAAADLAALRLTDAPEAFAALNAGLARSNLTDPAPPTWARLLWSSHPTPAARQEMARRWPLPEGAAP